MSAVHTLTDVEHDVWLDAFHTGSAELGVATPQPWSVRKRTLRGGPRDGVDLIEVDNGALKFCRPADPRHGTLARRPSAACRSAGRHRSSGRCIRSSSTRPGAAVSAGSPASTNGCAAAGCRRPVRPATTTARRSPCTAGSPTRRPTASKWPSSASRRTRFRSSARSRKAGLFSPRLRLTTTYTTRPGSNRLTIHDVVENCSGRPAEMQLLYHCNNGPPLLGEGSRVRVPVREVTPLTAWAAKGVKTWDTFAGPVAGFAEQVYACVPAADEQRQDAGGAARPGRRTRPGAALGRLATAVFHALEEHGRDRGRLRHRPGAGDLLFDVQGQRAVRRTAGGAAARRQMGNEVEHRSIRHGVDVTDAVAEVEAIQADVEPINPRARR